MQMPSLHILGLHFHLSDGNVDSVSVADCGERRVDVAKDTLLHAEVCKRLFEHAQCEPGSRDWKWAGVPHGQERSGGV